MLMDPTRDINVKQKGADCVARAFICHAHCYWLESVVIMMSYRFSLKNVRSYHFQEKWRVEFPCEISNPKLFKQSSLGSVPG